MMVVNCSAAATANKAIEVDWRQASGTVEVAIEEPVFVKEQAVEEIPREPTALRAL